MERSSRFDRFAPLSGALAIAVFIVAIALFPEEPPGADASRAEVTRFWIDNDTEAMVSAFLGTVAMVPLVWFGASLRSALREREGGAGRLSTIAFAGVVMFAVAVAVGSALQFALGEAADDLPPESVQTLSALVAGYFLPYLLGLATWMLGSAAAILRHGGLHPAFGWTALLLGIVALTPAGFATLVGACLWTIAASLLLFFDEDRRDAPRAPASSPGSPS